MKNIVDKAVILYAKENKIDNIKDKYEKTGDCGHETLKPENGQNMKTEENQSCEKRSERRTLP